MEEIQNFDIIKYHGNNNFFAILCHKNKENYYKIVSKTRSLSIFTEQKTQRITNGRGICLAEIVKSYSARAEINFKCEDKTLFKIINIKDENEFDHIVKVLECIL